MDALYKWIFECQSMFSGVSRFMLVILAGILVFIALVALAVSFFPWALMLLPIAFFGVLIYGAFFHKIKGAC